MVAMSGQLHDGKPDHGHDAHLSGHLHGHNHVHSGQAHPVLRPAVLGWAMVATLGLVVAEVFGGIAGRSVALLNDAVHNPVSYTHLTLPTICSV